MEYTKKEAKSYARKNMHGLWGSIPYAFTKTRELNEKGLVSDLRHYIDVLEVDGFYMGGIINEFWALTVEERKRVQELLIREAGGAIKTVTMTGHHCIGTAIELTRHAEKVGADFVCIMNPYYPPGPPEVVYNYFQTIADSAEIGILILNSVTSGYLLSPVEVARIAEIDNIVAIKNDGGIEHSREIRRLVGDRIVVSDPKEDNWLVNMVIYGQQAFIASPSPHLLQWKDHYPLRTYTRLAMEGKVEEAKKISATLDPLRRVAKRWIWDPWAKRELLPLARLKYWQELMGLTPSFVRPPLIEMTEEEKRRMRDELVKAGLRVVA